jgi:cell wall-associated NlpC family hydrolase
MTVQVNNPLAAANPGDIGVTSISGDVGKLITFGEWLNGNKDDKYDHAFIYVGNGQIVEAEPGKQGAWLGNVSEYMDGRPLAFSTGKLALDDGQGQKIADIALSLVGTKYSFLDYFSIAAHRFHMPIPGLKSYIASSKHMICSQLVDYVYQQAGFKLFTDGRWDGYVTPAALAERIGAK